MRIFKRLKRLPEARYSYGWADTRISNGLAKAAKTDLKEEV
jgi:hypothetical protein